LWAWSANNIASGTWRVSQNIIFAAITTADLANRLTDPNTHDAMHVSQEDDFVASAIVYPGTTEEVQTIVRWANKHRIPISPISIGRNCKSLDYFQHKSPELTYKPSS
jgi:FAD/FMN-containing dehydrogenase